MKSSVAADKLVHQQERLKAYTRAHIYIYFLLFFLFRFLCVLAPVHARCNNLVSESKKTI